MDMDVLTWLLLGIAVICVIVLLVCSALEPEPLSALMTLISQIAPMEVL